MNPNYAAGVNVAAQADDPGSLLNFYRALLRVRRATPALQTGALEFVHAEAEDYLAFVRRGDAEAALVVINMSAAAVEVPVAGLAGPLRRVFGGAADESGGPGLRLGPFETYIGVAVRA